MRIHTLSYLPLDALKGSTAYIEDILRIHHHHLGIRVLTSSLGRDIDILTLEELQEPLLDTLTTHIPGDGGIVTLTGELVYLVDEDDPALSQLDIVVGRLQESRQDALNVLAHVARLRKDGGIHNGKGNLKHPSNGAGEERLPGAGGPNDDHIALVELHLIQLLVIHLSLLTITEDTSAVESLVVVVHRHGKASLGSLLTDHILIQIVDDLGRLRELVEGGSRVLLMYGISLLRGLERHVDRLGTLVTEVADGTACHEVDHTLRPTTDAAEVIVAKHPVVVTS